MLSKREPIRAHAEVVISLGRGHYTPPLHDPPYPQPVAAEVVAALHHDYYTPSPTTRTTSEDQLPALVAPHGSSAPIVAARSRWWRGEITATPLILSTYVERSSSRWLGGEGREVRSEPVTTARRDIRWQTKERRR